MCGLGFVGLIMFVVVSLLLLLVLGLVLWYASRLVRSRLTGRGARTRALATLAVFLVMAAAVFVLLSRLFLAVTPCPAP